MISSFGLKSYHDLLSNLKPTKKAVLYIIDSGIEGGHEDLQYALPSNQSKFHYSDTRGHGTHCAGIAGAVTNNSLGITSVVPSGDWVEIRSIRVINNMGFAPQADILDAITKAVDEGADVISLSLGAYSTEGTKLAYQEVMQYALERGVIVIAAAGNSSKPASTTAPANIEGVIAVAALDQSGRLASFSNTVSDVAMGVAAPGVSILSTFPGNGYKVNSGTSMAAPFVAGIASIAKAINPEITCKDFYKTIKSQQRPMTTSETGIIIMPEGVIKHLVDSKGTSPS